MSEPYLHIQDPSRRPKPAIPPRARKLASLTQTPKLPTTEVEVKTTAVEAAVVAAAATPIVNAEPVVEAKPVLEAAPQETKKAKKGSSKESSGNGLVQAVIVSLMGLALAGYAFNVGNLQTLADGFVVKLNLNAQAQATSMAPMLVKVLPYLMLLPAMLLLYVLLTILASVLGLKKKSKPRSSRGPREDFRLSAETRGVGPRIAYQTYLLLEPILPEGHTLEISDRLEDDLGLSDQQIRSVRHALLENTHKQFDAAAPLTRVQTVLGMMVSAQQAPARTREAHDPVYLPGDPSRKRA